RIPDLARRNEAVALWEKLQEARRAYCAHVARDNLDLMILWNRTVERCALSGVPLWKDDEIVEDTETGEKYLRVALGLPPRLEGPENASDGDAITDEEDAA
ncbi:MAG TPA: hypothetical protein VG963_25570, partial [Polyangiaceae bacterium]|nr:hypothetical protein [Polyangiaceae bacterium]